jgi:hypothetical protein
LVELVAGHAPADEHAADVARLEFPRGTARRRSVAALNSPADMLLVEEQDEDARAGRRSARVRQASDHQAAVAPATSVIVRPST